ncbi:MAG: IPT/TIG domain-containing protein [Tannerella sp.]|nr:IPT/TIG domain-containing protein [Tannerella sp.]
MKKVFNVKFLLPLFIVTVIVQMLFYSCEDDDKKVIVYDPSKPVELTSFRPDSGRIREMVLVDGKNFGSDASKIKVFFNQKEARVLSSTGERILALVPRLPGDTCILTVEVEDQKKSFDNYFRYKVEASVTTLAGNGTAALVTTSLDQSQINPVYMCVDQNFNIFVTVPENDALVKISELENSIQVMATNAQGINHRCTPTVHPETNVLMMGAQGSNTRDRFVFCDPQAGWVPKIYFIKNWNLNGFTAVPTNSDDETHFHCCYCEADGFYYARYASGQIVKIDSKTWDATIVGLTPRGYTYGLALHPVNKSEMWFAYCSAGSPPGDVRHSLCMIDLQNPPQTASPTDPDFHKLSGPTAGGFRDGTLDIAQFNEPRMINFDADGNLYMGDSNNHCIRIINTRTLMVSTLIGIPQNSGMVDGARENARFKEPHGIVVDAEGVIYVSDYGNKRVRRIAVE